MQTHNSGNHRSCVIYGLDIIKAHALSSVDLMQLRLPLSAFLIHLLLTTDKSYHFKMIVVVCSFAISFVVLLTLYLKPKFVQQHKEQTEALIPIIKMGNSNVDIDQIVPRSVNYHFTRQCNYECGFCFHTAKTSYVLGLEDAKKGLKMLQEAGLEKINFSGGEPFLPMRGNHLGEMVKFCKIDLGLPSVTIVTNGSLVTEKWFKNYGVYLDIMAVSCDSFNEDTNKAIGRGQGKKSHIDQLFKVKNWCNQYNVLFKLNTVVNTYNHDEDMSEIINKLNPIRWKVFQCLLLEGENAGPDALRNAERFYIADDIFNQFIERHKTITCLVPESNAKMQNSYLILDEYMRFLDCRDGSKKPSKSLLDVGVANALKFSGFDETMFKKRGGIYKWSKAADSLSW